jgi:two-component system LytT family response regulator
MENIRVLIVDDEPLAREGVRMLLKAEPDIEIIGECRNGREAVKTILRARPDLVLLDIQMPGMDGFEVLEAIGAQRMPQVIFVTAYDEHALRAFEVSALDYLLKPIDAARFQEALARARDRIRGNNLAALATQLQQMMATWQSEKNYLERIAIKSTGRVVLLGVHEIDWIEAADNYVQLHAGKVSHLLLATMNGLASRLNPQQFLRIHRSTIVNVQRIKELQPLFHGEYRIILQDNTELTSGRSYSKQLHKLLDNL